MNLVGATTILKTPAPDQGTPSPDGASSEKPLNETHARQASEVRARRRSRRRPGLRRLISREVRNLAGGRCSREVAGNRVCGW